uniref:Blood group Rh(D) polypeptide n=1 Tax=Sciurus vulgaris TaxID=55149 RepID=A0A8D2CK68_SCIVU
MGSKYPRSVRDCLPLWTVTLEAVLIVLVSFTGFGDQLAYQGVQEPTIMAVFGLGFLNSSLRRLGWSSVGFNLFMLVLAVQWAVLVDGLFSLILNGKVPIKLNSMYSATMSAVTVLISAGTVLGRANLAQLTVMTLLEVTVVSVTRMVTWKFFYMEHHTDALVFPVFAAYFGLTVAWCLSQPLPEGVEEKAQMATSPSLFGMLGTLFLWIFWPSFNSAPLDLPSEKRTVIFNTYFALAVSAVTATCVSALAHPQGKINMIHTHNAVLAGGVALSAPGHLISSPWVAMLLGLMAGLISIGGAKCLVSFNHVLGIQDFNGVHYTFGLPGLLGEFAYLVLLWNTKPSMVDMKVLMGTAAFSFAVILSLASGLLTGLLLKLKIWRAPHETKLDDQTFWEFPHLAVGF